MTIQEAITLAIYGGYHRHASDGGETSSSGARSDSSAWTSKDHDASCLVAVEETFLDPAFWQALGRVLRWQGRGLPDFALHWELIEAEAREAIAHDLLVNGIPLWLYHWHRFVDWFAEGKTPEDFFATLPSLRMERRSV